MSHLSWSSARLIDLADHLSDVDLVEPDVWARRVEKRLCSHESRMAYLSLSRRIRAYGEHHAVDLFQATGTRFSDKEQSPAVNPVLHRYVSSLLSM